MSGLRSRGAVAALLAFALAATSGAGPAAAGAGELHVVRTITTKVVQPLQFAVQGMHVYVADSARSTLTEVGRTRPLARGGDVREGGDLAAVAASGTTLGYAWSSGDRTVTKLQVLRNGKRVLSVDLAAYERRHDPDARVRYGLQRSASATCQRQIEATFSDPASHRGSVGSHPVAVAALAHGAWAVVDQDANDVLKVDRHGHVSVLGVLPGRTVPITAAYAKRIGAPACVGNAYRFESRPTDVERARGQLWVTSQPGETHLPVSAFLATNPDGALYRIQHAGAVHLVASGFDGATGVAVSTGGRIFVAELYTGRIAVVRSGRPHRVGRLPNVFGLEWANGRLFAAVMGPTATSPTNARARIVRLG